MRLLPLVILLASACTAIPDPSGAGSCADCSPEAGQVFGPCLADGTCADGSFCISYLGGRVCASACPNCPDCGDLQSECTLAGSCMALCTSDKDCLAGQVCSYDGDLAPHACVWP